MLLCKDFANSPTFREPFAAACVVEESAGEVRSTGHACLVKIPLIADIECLRKIVLKLVVFEFAVLDLIVGGIKSPRRATISKKLFS